MNNKNDLISIAMTTYNGEKYLREQLDSILNQTYKNIEIVVCDDCSTDSTSKILEEYSNKYNNIRVFYNTETNGVNKNFEKVINLCMGDYIAISDQDDIWNNDKLELLINNINEFDVICANKTDIDDNNNLLPDIHFKTFEFAKIFKYDESNFLNMYFTNILWGCTSLIRKNFLLTCIPFPLAHRKNEPPILKEIMYYDHWICLCAYANKSIKYLDKSVIKHRVHNNNCTRSSNNKNPYIRWIKNLDKNKIKEYYLTEIERINLILSRLNLDEKSKNIMMEMRKINESILDFRFSIKDFKLLYLEFKLYKKINRRSVFILKSFAERIILAVLSCFHHNR